MTHTQSFRFVDHKITKLSYLPNTNFDIRSKMVEVLPKFNIYHEKKDKEAEVQLSVKIDNDKAPFHIDVVLTGRFVFEEECPDEELEKIVRINCASMMFPFIREIISDISVRGGFSPLLLPPLNFVEAYKKSERQKEDNNSE